MNSTATTNWGYQATVGTAARTHWTAAPARFASPLDAAISPMPSIPVVKHNTVKSNHTGIRHRPPEDSN